MSDHLSECLWDDYWAECICPDLRVYGERMRAACIAAIEAVDPKSEEYDDWHPNGLRLALNALREVQP